MIMCEKCDIPCCDFCVHVIHDTEKIDGKMVNLAPIGCSLHADEKHQNLARGCSYCDDYHCRHAK